MYYPLGIIGVLLTGVSQSRQPTWKLGLHAGSPLIKNEFGYVILNAFKYIIDDEHSSDFRGSRNP